MSDLIQITGLWENEDKNGNVYFNGSFGFGGKLLIMKNKYKEKTNDPDYIAYVAPKPKKGAAEQSNDAPDNDDIPF